MNDLWAWAILQGDTRANSVPPMQITRSSDPDPGERGHVESLGIIGGLPFTVRFETYIDGEERTSPVERALAHLQSDPSQRLEFEICWAIVHGAHEDPELLRGILGVSPQLFDYAAARGLGYLKKRADEYLQKELEGIAQRTFQAGEAEKEMTANRPMTKRGET